MLDRDERSRVGPSAYWVGTCMLVDCAERGRRFARGERLGDDSESSVRAEVARLADPETGQKPIDNRSQKDLMSSFMNSLPTIVLGAIVVAIGIPVFLALMPPMAGQRWK